MIRVLLMGGLGNQMLQYATAKALALSLQDEVCLDMSFFAIHGKKDWCRAYEMDIFAHTAKVESASWKSKLLCHLIPRLQKHLSADTLLKMGIIVDTKQLAKAAARRDYYLMDYFFSDHFFKEYKTEILQDLAFRLPMNEANSTIASRIADCTAVGVHIRRGDYLSNANAAQTFAAVPQTYYTQAMAYIRDRVDNPTFFVFSDDIAWCKTFLDDTCEFVDINYGAESYNDMRLMSLCQHNIIANSTFSWWGAWLNAHPGKIVIAPKAWFKNEVANANQERYPAEWIQL